MFIHLGLFHIFVKSPFRKTSHLNSFSSDRVLKDRYIAIYKNERICEVEYHS